jgi:hypothetical protein
LHLGWLHGTCNAERVELYNGTKKKRKVQGGSRLITVWGGRKSKTNPFQRIGKSKLKMQDLYSARKAITLIVEVANAGGAHMILVVLTVSLVPSA